MHSSIPFFAKSSTIFWILHHAVAKISLDTYKAKALSFSSPIFDAKLFLTSLIGLVENVLSVCDGDTDNVITKFTKASRYGWALWGHYWETTRGLDFAIWGYTILMLLMLMTLCS